jgi:hypothetical protein
MTIEQTIEVPADHRLTIDVPREVPAGSTILTFRPAKAEKTDKAKQRPITGRLADSLTGIDEVRLLLQKEMAQNGTAAIPATSGGGWETHVWERYAES